MTAEFERAFDWVVGEEGGYVDDANDPGGETRFGISKHAYPDEDIPNMTLTRAQALYQRDYWAKLGGDELPVGIGLVLFDWAVNSGVGTAVKALQKLVGVVQDGIIGPTTIAAAKQYPARSIIQKLSASRALHVMDLPMFVKFGHGWITRVIETAVEAI